jgi:hypothetical protein
MSRTGSRRISKHVKMTRFTTLTEGGEGGSEFPWVGNFACRIRIGLIHVPTVGDEEIGFVG